MLTNTLNNKLAVIHVDALRREFTSDWMLAEKLKLEGCRVLLTSRHSTRHFLRYITPDIFISSHVFQLTPAENRDLVSRGVHIYINEVEGAEHEVGQMTTYPALVEGQMLDYHLFSGIFVWSEVTRDWLVKNRLLNQSKIYLTGNIRLSQFTRASRKASSNVIGILCRFELINTFDNRHPFENLCTIDPEDSQYRWYYGRLAIDSEVFSITVKFIENAVARGMRVSMRPHPNENLDAYGLLKRRFGENVIIDKSFTIEGWLNTVTVVFGTTSTAFADCYVARIPIISTELIQRFHYTEGTTSLDKFGLIAYHPSTVGEAVDICARDGLSPRVSNEFDEHMKRFYSLGNPIDPIDAVVRAVKGDFEKKTVHIIKASNFYIAFAFLFALDIFSIVRVFLGRRPFARYRILKTYSFNRLIHTPDSFMRGKRETL